VALAKAGALLIAGSPPFLGSRVLGLVLTVISLSGHISSF
jgi:hypothetical protein